MVSLLIAALLVVLGFSHGLCLGSCHDGYTVSLSGTGVQMSSS
jgi:hypothetical protein